MRVGLVQMACGPDPLENVAKAADGARRAAAAGAEVVCLQELHNTLYFCQGHDASAFDLAEPVPGPTTRSFGALAARLGVVIVASVFERRAPGLYHNTAAVLDVDGSLAGLYRKMHIPDDPGFHEKYYFAPGDLGFRPVRTSKGRLGVMVCWDQWFPEAARLMALAGAELLLYPTAIGWDPGEDPLERERQLDAWTTCQRGHAIANGLPLVAVNRVGVERASEGAVPGSIAFWGSSFAVGPQGEFLARLGDAEEVAVCDIDLSRTERVRRAWPFLRDRRIDAFAGLQARHLD